MISVLVVDDKISDVNGIIKNIEWEELGYYVCGKAYNGEEGYNAALIYQPDVIITDISMPTINGIEMTAKIKEQLPHVKVIFMSCFDEFEFAQNAIQLNVNRYILKPIDLLELSNVLKELASKIQREFAEKIHKEHLENKIKESLPLLQNEFYHDLILGKLKDHDAIVARMRYLELDYDMRYLSVMCFEIDNYELNYGTLRIEDKYMLLERIKVCIEETILNSNKGFVVKQEFFSLIVVVFNETLENSDDMFAKSANLANVCKDYINNILNVNITIGISRVGTQFTEIPQMIIHAKDTVKSKFYGAGNSVILALEPIEIEEEPNYNLASIKKDVSTILESHNEKQLDIFIDHYYSNVGTQSEYYFKTLSYSIVNTIQVILFERNLSYKDVFDSEMLIWDKLLRFETIIDIKMWIKNIIIAVGDSINDRDKNRYKKIVEDIKGIIDTEYEEILNVAQIVEPLCISLSYANSIFKKETNMTIFEYLLQRKVDAAREMLKDPYCRISDIAERLGYKSNAYFTSVFKQYIGITPKEYRNRYC